jgi:hypothetical protein
VYVIKTGGFFVECGALDGETLSNTLYMERHLNWQGLLVEADPLNFYKVVNRKRKAWLAPTCLSVMRNPHMVIIKFKCSYSLIYFFHQVNFKQQFMIGKIKNITNEVKNSLKGHVVVQCIPITTLLLALNKREVDYFSLDVEGNDLEVLKTIDFDKINIKVYCTFF